MQQHVLRSMMCRWVLLLLLAVGNTTAGQPAGSTLLSVCPYADLTLSAPTSYYISSNIECTSVRTYTFAYNTTITVNLEATRVLRRLRFRIEKSATLTIASDGAWGNGTTLKMTGNTVIAAESILFHMFEAIMPSPVLYCIQMVARIG
jgi:hypothetical protein